MTIPHPHLTSALVGLLSVVACRKSDPPLPASAPVSAPTQSARIPAPAISVARQEHDPPWTPDRVRTFVLGIHLEVHDFLRELFKKREPAVMLGSCFDTEGVRSLAKKADVLAFLEKRVTGPTLPCYVATYFGCTLGEWIGNAGVALRGGSDFEPFTTSRVTIVEQTPDRVVADILEAQMELVIDGVLDREQLSEQELADMNNITRYVLSRDEAGVWRISDRQVTFELWECRPR